MKPTKNDKLYIEVKSILEDARKSAYRAVNFTMVLAYWEIGKRIVEHEQAGEVRAGYGKGLLKELAKKLTADFGKGFTETNLKYFRQFYIAFPPADIGHAVRDQSGKKNTMQKGHALRGELSWTQQEVLHYKNEHMK